MTSAVTGMGSVLTTICTMPTTVYLVPVYNYVASSTPPTVFNKSCQYAYELMIVSIMWPGQ